MRRSRRAVAAGAAILAIALAGAGLWTAPRWLVPWLAASMPECLYIARTAAPVVALTIDDVPDATTTPLLRETLARHAARATFFVISGRIRGNEGIVQALVADGHELGNHLTHDEPSIRLSDAEFEQSLLEAGRALAVYDSGYDAVTGSVRAADRGARPGRWMRPGSGLADSAMLATAARHGYGCALGSVYPLDPAVPSAGFAASYILANVRPGGVIVLHDGGGRGRRTRATLDRVLPELARRGLRVVTLSEMVSLRE